MSRVKVDKGLAAVRRAVRRRKRIAEVAAQDAALAGDAFMKDFHMGGYSALACLEEDLGRIERRRRETGR